MGDWLTKHQSLESLSSPLKKSDFCGLLKVFLYIERFQGSSNMLGFPSHTPNREGTIIWQRRGRGWACVAWTLPLWSMPWTNRVSQLKDALSGRGKVVTHLGTDRSKDAKEPDLRKTHCFSAVGPPVRATARSLLEQMMTSKETQVFSVVTKEEKMARGINISTNKFFLWDVWLSANFYWTETCVLFKLIHGVQKLKTICWFLP